jgi:UDP-glucose 4-epimerase
MTGGKKMKPEIIRTDAIRDASILVTGGAGFVGSFVVEELLIFEPRRIIILDNLCRGKRENMENFIDDHRVEFILGDIRDEQLIDNLMRQCDYCFHLAALRVNTCAADPREAFDVMAKATFQLIESAHRHRLKKIIYSSSASIYGLAQNFPTPETDHPYDNKTFYGAVKLLGEQLLRSYHHMYGLDYIGLRYFNIYGPRMDIHGKYTEVLIRWLDCIRDNRNPIIYGDGSATMDFVFVKDVAKANMLALCAQATDEILNIGSQEETSLRELLGKLLKIHHSLLKPFFSPENEVNPVKRRLADIKKAAELLGFHPLVGLEQGLRELSTWYFQKYPINNR